MKKIVVACGSGIATSTVVATKVKDLLDGNGVTDYEITKCSIAEAPSQCDGATLLVCTAAAPASIPCPVVSGVPFLTTVGKAQAEQDILAAVK